MNHGPLDLQSNALPLSYTPSLLLKYIVTIVTMISYMMYCPKQMLFLHHKTFLINIIEMQMSILWQQVCKEVVTHTVKVIAIKKISKTPYKNDYTFLTNIIFDEMFIYLPSICFHSGIYNHFHYIVILYRLGQISTVMLFFSDWLCRLKTFQQKLKKKSNQSSV